MSASRRQFLEKRDAEKSQSGASVRDASRRRPECRGARLKVTRTASEGPCPMDAGAAVAAASKRAEARPDEREAGGAAAATRSALSGLRRRPLLRRRRRGAGQSIGGVSIGGSIRQLRTQCECLSWRR